MMKLFRFLKPYRFPVALVLVLIFSQSLAELYLPTLMSDIVDIGIIKGDIPYILKIGGLMLFVAAAGMTCAFVASFLSSRVSAGFGQILRGQIFSHVENFSFQEFDKIGTASLITRTTNDITQVQQVVTMMLRMMVRAPMMCIGGIMMAVSKDAKLSLVIILVIPILAAAIYAVISRSLPLFKVMQLKLDKLNLVLRENLTGIRVIRAFNRIEQEQRRFDTANLDLTGTAIKVNKVMAVLMPMMMLMLNFSIIGIIWFGSIQIDTGNIQVGDLMAFIQYAMQILFSLMMFSMMIVMIPRASVSAVRINEVLNMVPEIKDAAQVKHTGTNRGYVKFKNVTFSYPGAEKPVLAGISFDARPGEITAIIGGTGSGKSTLISLIPRFYDIDSGSVMVDGVDVRELSQGSLRARIGFVPQKAVLFTGTILDNIRYGKEAASEAEVQYASEVAQVTDFILGMQDGFNAVIAQGGMNISGGQKQRLAIARALVRRPEIYIFDDSFSALDYKTDAKLRAALKKETSAATVIIVTQRVSTVIYADRIIVLDQGQVAGIGNHRELISSCKVYHEIVASQLSEEEIA